jgi:2-(1,2-epoxy-1,2-dihydrophenyl)acetyl-CoA isomerase
LTTDEELEAQTYAFARRLAMGPAIALRCIKENVHSALDDSLERACDTEMRNMIRCRMTHDSQEAIKALTEKREPTFGGI